VLVGEAAAKQDGDDLVVVLDVVVPGLNDYRYRVLRYRQPLEMYPGDFWALGTHKGNIPDEPKFIEAVKESLSSDKAKNVLISLLAQVSGI
jgi:hypothetical protein